MITINHPSVQTEGNAVTISYPILQDGHAPRTLSFTVDSRFRDFLNPGRADGALVALLPWISQQGGQVRVLPAISAHLYHFGIRLLSHILTGIGPFLKPVELAGEVHAEVLSPIPGCRIGTGGSLGVDSLCTIAELEKAGTPVTHLFHNNCGTCLKCRRTISQLYLLGHLQEFSKVFNLRAFQDKPLRFLAKTIVHSGHFQQEMLYLLKHSTVLSPSEKRQVWFHCIRKQPSLLSRSSQ